MISRIYVSLVGFCSLVYVIRYRSTGLRTPFTQLTFIPHLPAAGEALCHNCIDMSPWKQYLAEGFASCKHGPYRCLVARTSSIWMKPNPIDVYVACRKTSR